MSRIRTSILVLVVLFAPAAAVAQSWPTAQPIKAVITFSAGSASDVIARAVFDQVSTQIGQTIVVKIASARAARSVPMSSRKRRRTATRCSCTRLRIL
jgi:tripartite-type tricarboxylate transporter receptor subunit TctC